MLSLLFVLQMILDGEADVKQTEDKEIIEGKFDNSRLHFLIWERDGDRLLLMFGEQMPKQRKKVLTTLQEYRPDGKLMDVGPSSDLVEGLQVYIWGEDEEFIKDKAGEIWQRYGFNS